MNPPDDSDCLKPCPFCGSAAEFGTAPDGGVYVQCMGKLCFASSALIYPLMDDVKSLLLERWNRRTQP